MPQPSTANWYVRDTDEGELFGPVTFAVARAHARHLSTREDGPRTAQVLREIDPKWGDGVRNPLKLAIAYTYINGRQTYQGRVKRR